jgi:hypothetical protein
MIHVGWRHQQGETLALQRSKQLGQPLEPARALFPRKVRRVAGTGCRCRANGPMQAAFAGLRSTAAPCDRAFRKVGRSRRAAIYQHQHLFSSSAIGATARQSRSRYSRARHRHCRADKGCAIPGPVCSAAVLVDDDGLNLQAAEPDLLIGQWGGSRLQLVDDISRAIAGGNAKTVRSRPGQEGHDPTAKNAA